MWHLANLGASDNMIFWMILGTVAVVAIVAGSATSILNARGKERTRREIAAYLAEGTIDKDTALAMLKVDSSEEDDTEEG